ncbi:MAG: hypothetical protein A2284_10745 [Deltaproteobacteria bacterium RIFOXYA12_FULL_61_11]|nr:MAG: hypothetical protein A2284_10745 [Deltaproteobacteria bacterium RIFOXYA12_FULL_61_11]
MKKVVRSAGRGNRVQLWSCASFLGSNFLVVCCCLLATCVKVHDEQEGKETYDPLSISLEFDREETIIKQNNELLIQCAQFSEANCVNKEQCLPFYAEKFAVETARECYHTLHDQFLKCGAIVQNPYSYTESLWGKNVVVDRFGNAWEFDTDCSELGELDQCDIAMDGMAGSEFQYLPHPLADVYWSAHTQGIPEELIPPKNVLMHPCPAAIPAQGDHANEPVALNSSHCSSLSHAECKKTSNCRYVYGTMIETELSCYHPPEKVGCIAQTTPCETEIAMYGDDQGNCWVFFQKCVPENDRYRTTDYCDKLLNSLQDTSLELCDDTLTWYLPEEG